MPKALRRGRHPTQPRATLAEELGRWVLLHTRDILSFMIPISTAISVCALWLPFLNPSPMTWHAYMYICHQPSCPFSLYTFRLKALYTRKSTDTYIRCVCAGSRARRPAYGKLTIATKQGDFKKCLHLLTQGCNPNEIEERSGAAPLHHASWNGNVDISALLITRGGVRGEGSW